MTPAPLEPHALYIWNRSTAVSDGDLDMAVAAIQIQVTEHLYPHWQADADLVVLPKDQSPPPLAWVITLADLCPEPGDLGYHEDDSLPSGIVGVKTCQQDGVSWSSCLSHEVLELVVDPYAVTCMAVGANALMLEISDAVEGKPYKVNGVEVENFVLPDWYRRESLGPWDYCGVLTGPLQLAHGGYLSSAPLGAWGQTNGEHVRACKARPRHESRRARRMRMGMAK